MGGTRAVPLALEKLARALGVEFRRNVNMEKIVTADGAVTGVLAPRLGGRGRCGRVELRLRPHPSRTDQRRGLGARSSGAGSYEPACSGVVLYLGLKQALRAPRASRLCLQPRPAGGVRLHLPERAARAGPDLLLAATTCTEPGIAPPAAKRSTCSSTRRICARITIGKRCCPSIAASFWKSSSAPARMPDIESRIVFEQHAHAAGHPRPLPRARRRDLRPRQPREISRRIQARQPQPRPARPLPRRRRRASRPRHADGAHVRLDRRRRAGPRRIRRRTWRRRAK